MSNSALKTFTFIVDLIVTACLLFITSFIEDIQFNKEFLKSGADYFAYIMIAVVSMPFFTFVMRSISNSSYIWVLGGILTGVASVLFMNLIEYYYFIVIAVFVVCCLGIFVPEASDNTSTRDRKKPGCNCDCDCNCNQYCDCCVGECF